MGSGPPLATWLETAALAGPLRCRTVKLSIITFFSFCTWNGSSAAQAAKLPVPLPEPAAGGAAAH